MGSAFAAFLTASGEDVVLIGRSPAYSAAVSERGLRVERPDGSFTIEHVTATSSPRDLEAGSLDVLVLLTKTFDSVEALGATAHTLAATGFAVSLQNGLGNETALVAHFGGPRSLIGVTTVGAHLHEPGRITITPTTAAATSKTHIGFPRGIDGDLRGPRDFAERCSRAGLPTTLSELVERDVWTKLALAAMGPASAVLRRSVVRVWEQAEGRALIRSMFDEVIAVSQAEGIGLDAEAAWAHSVATYAGTGDHTTSMCTDVLTHRRTEIDSMAGEVARRGAIHGVPTPVHNTICALIKTMEATYAYDR